MFYASAEKPGAQSRSQRAWLLLSSWHVKNAFPGRHDLEWL